MSNEQIQKLYDEIGILNSHYKALLDQEAVINSAYGDAKSAALTMREAATSSELDALVPIGSGIFFDAHVKNPAKVVLNIGAGVALEKDRAYATNYVESRIKELDVALGNAAARKQEIMERIRKNREKLEQLVRPTTEPANRND